MTDALSLPPQSHGHLRLSTVLTPQPRRRPPRRGTARVPHYPNRTQHAQQLRDEAVNAVHSHHVRHSVLGVNPDLVFVLELNRSVDPSLLNPTDLALWELASGSAMVVFASDIELSSFRGRLDSYAADDGPVDRVRSRDELFDAIDRMRPLNADDVLSPTLKERLVTVSTGSLRLDVQCWCPEESAEAQRIFDDAALAVVGAGGRVLGSERRFTTGLSVHRIEMPANAVRDLADTRRVRSIDVLPSPQLTLVRVLGMTPADLPVALPPAPASPLLAVIDSGVASGHPLIAPAVHSLTAADGRDATDANGHGTFVASLALYGSLEPLIAARHPIRAAGRLISIRVLDHEAGFPLDTPWETVLLTAIEDAAAAGARVINLSLGDPRQPYHPPRPTVLGSAVDALIRRLNVVVVISTGNYEEWRYVPDPRRVNDYPEVLLRDTDSGLLDPATAALALTVGALCTDSGQAATPARENLDRRPMGQPGFPSPVTRVGPGPMDMIKPELCAPGGGAVYDHEANRVLTSDPSVMVVGVDGTRPDRLLARHVGTSFAAPLVSHAALRVIGEYPDLTANGVRALLLASVDADDVVSAVDGHDVDARRAQARLTGYGRVSAPRAAASDDFRAVLLAEQEITVDDVHVFTVPIPGSFRRSGGWRRITVSLACDPPVRPTRRDYLANKMWFHAFLGEPVERVRAAYSAPPVADTGAPGEPDPPVPAALGGAHIDKLYPTERKLGANQYATRTFSRVLKPEQDPLVVVVGNTNRWDVPGARQNYALAVALEREPWRGGPVYAELRAQFELLAEQEIELN